jgi:hypothetical protein
MVASLNGESPTERNKGVCLLCSKVYAFIFWWDKRNNIEKRSADTKAIDLIIAVNLPLYEE